MLRLRRYDGGSQAGRTRGQIAGRQRKRGNFDEDGSGGIRQTYADAR